MVPLTSLEVVQDRNEMIGEDIDIFHRTGSRAAGKTNFRSAEGGWNNLNRKWDSVRQRDVLT
jgi:hypothetical protein